MHLVTHTLLKITKEKKNSLLTRRLFSSSFALLLLLFFHFKMDLPCVVEQTFGAFFGSDNFSN